MKDGKMSKSRSNVVYPKDVTSRYGLDSLRYYLLREMPLGNDAIFSYDRFIERYNADLANDIGNLLSRSVSMINKYFGGVVTYNNIVINKYTNEVIDTLNNTINKFDEAFSNFRFQNGLIELWNLIARTNKYIDETTPWILSKDSSKKDELNEVMYTLYEVLRNVSILVSPVMPIASKKIFEALAVSLDLQKFEKLGYGNTKEVKVMEKIEPLFVRLDLKKELEEIESANVKKLELKPEITIEDFDKIDLRVGKVLEAKKLDGSDKLLVLQVKIEEEVRQIVSGIALNYKPEEMVGKYVVVVANLKPVKLRGVMSNGMILAASGSRNGALEVIEINKESEFSKVK